MGSLTPAGLCFMAGVFAATVFGADAAVPGVRVCTLLQDPAAYAGRTVLVLGRYSYRGTGRFLSEAGCDLKQHGGAVAWPGALRIVLDSQNGPKAPERLAVDSESVSRNLAVVQKTTTLGKFRFGSTDYDRWAAVYGRIEIAPEFPAGTPQPPARKGEFEPVPARIICRGESLIIQIGEGD